MSVIACPSDPLLNEPVVQQLQLRCQNRLSNPAQRLLPVGAQSKTGLIDGVLAERIEMASFAGVTAYDPSEFLITARAGTPIQVIADQLAKHGQYLPFDPLFSQQGATLGGTIASGVSGPNRLLYGGLRDFVMEVALLDGLGKVVRGGGKVVKNAAGFDLPKMMVGSYGRMGIILDATLKVFPEPQGMANLLIETASAKSAVQTMQTILSKPFPITGLDIAANHHISLRIAGPSSSLASVIERIMRLIPQQPCKTLDQSSVGLRPAAWLEASSQTDQVLLKLVESPVQLVQLDSLLATMDCEYQHLCAGMVAWVKLGSSRLPQLDRELSKLKVSGTVIRGSCGQPFVGDREWLKMATRIQGAMDPHHLFVDWN
jgi:glycolate oxidase FAD binding subunit